MFNYDNKVFEFINRVVDTMFTTLLWVVFSLPVITLGASTTAFYEVVHKVLRKNKGYVWHTWVQGAGRGVSICTCGPGKNTEQSGCGEI